MNGRIQMTTQCPACGTFVHRYQSQPDGQRVFVKNCSWCNAVLPPPDPRQKPATDDRIKEPE